MSASERPSDKGGSQPENQRKRAEIRGPRHALIGVLVVVAVGAITIGLMLVARSDGGLARLSPGLLASSPFTSFRGLGLVLAILVGGTHALAASLFLREHERARHLAAIASMVAVVLGAV
ncbi:MAG: hypothetical protein H0T79_22090, partial [Deltaproteobacteria bacterium]|nr:hypothetical protein [Deltaproteobacteria bacterium]